MKKPNPGSVIALWIFVGVVIGAAVGSASDRIDVWIGIGAVVGAIIGYGLSRRIDKSG